MTALAELSKTDIAKRWEAAKSTAQRYKQDAKRVARVGTSAMATTAGGAVAGALAVKYAFIPGTQVRTDVALGCAIIGGAMLDVFDGLDDTAVDFASGLLAVAAARETAKYFVREAKKSGAPVGEINI